MMSSRFILAAALALLSSLQPAIAAPPSRLAAEAARVTITRDDWGIAHVHGHTDADAVFAMAYAQAEDDFNRVEANYLTALGRTAEAAGESKVYQDLRARLWVDPRDLQARYRRSPAWLRSLMNAWADGLNCYLATHPQTHPKVITHFEPWMALSFTEGSIGGDVERVDLNELQSFYGGGKSIAQVQTARTDLPPVDPQGSNGIAIGRKDSADHHALLLINPHTSFYFRSELQMSSDEGLDAYGAVTWGQFFIYQGFNRHIGWMHTSTSADNVDQFAETIVRKHGKLFYRYGSELRPVAMSTVDIRYRTANGGFATKRFTVYRTHHGPIVAKQNGKWIAEALMYRPIRALEQSYLRTKASDFASYRKIAELKANSSNNTIFADDKGEIAYMHPQFMPRRDDRFDYTKPVDGSNPATDWHGLHKLSELPHLLDPATGWLFNSNNWPYSAAGPDSPKQADYPRYMDTVGETARGRHALLLLTTRHDFTIETLRAAAFDSYLPFFAALIPQLTSAYDAESSGTQRKAELTEPVAALRAWDDRWGTDSIPTSLAIFWAEALSKTAGSVKQEALAATSPEQKLTALSSAVEKLDADFGTWRTPWGQINRFQRLSSHIDQVYDDSKPSIPVGFVSGIWGSLAAFYADPAPNTKRRYGHSGNSFVAVVDFGPRVHAIAVTAGGESGHPQSKHFDDEAERYATGNLRTVYFYPDQLKGHTERVYHPGR